MPPQSVDGASSPPPPPKGADNRQKLQALLSQQVDSGTISQDQATLLSDFFAMVAAKGGPTGGGPGGGPGGESDGDNEKGAKDDSPRGTEGLGAAGRRPPAPPPPPPATVAASTTDTNVSSPLKDALDAFLKALKDNQTKATAYGAAVAAPPNSAALFVDKLV